VKVGLRNQHGWKELASGFKMSRQTFSRTKFYSCGVKFRLECFAMLEIAVLSKFELSSCAVEDFVCGQDS
jgi:hypothetical protein